MPRGAFECPPARVAPNTALPSAAQRVTSFWRSELQFSRVDDVDVTIDGRILLLQNQRLYQSSESLSSIAGLQNGAATSFTWSVYPNPATTQVRLATDEWQVAQGLEAELFDVLGRTVAKWAGRDQVSVQHLSSGVYFLRFAGQTGSLVIQ
jgi:Secretion system C-terminal sorting domain